MNISRRYKLWFGISLAVIVLGLGAMLTMGLNMGIDFIGGTMMQINMNKVVEVPEVKETIASYDLKPEIVHAGAEKKEIIIKTKKSLTNDERIEIFNTIKEKYDLQDSDMIGANNFGPSIGKEIRHKALIAILLASVGMFLYIIFRFELMYGFSSIIALMHDVLVLVAVYALFRIPVNSSFIAAVLTIVGYSINDTIVVFDRVRENVHHMSPKTSYLDVADQSLAQTITRSINTSLTTLLVIGSLYVFGVDSIKEFAFPLMMGVLVGTYSSIFIASPLWALFSEARRNKNKKYHAKA